MPSIKIELEADDTIQVLKDLAQETDKPFADRLTGAIADLAIREYKQALVENGSVVTGHGLESIQSTHLETGKYGVMMAGYLDQVDKGTTPAERLPITDYTRFKAAADEYGMSVLTLESVIKREGTQAHPFKQRALRRTTSFAEEEAQRQLDQLLQDAGGLGF